MDDSVTNEDCTAEHIKQRVNKTLIELKKTLINFSLPLFKAISAKFLRTLLYDKILLIYDKEM